MTHKDSRGTPLRVGQHVAYNRSGNVITGTITFLGKKITIVCDDEFILEQWSPETRSFVLPDAPAPSRVRHGSSVLVLS